MGAITSAVSGLTSAVGVIRDVVGLAENPSSLNPLATQGDLIAKQQKLALQQLQQKQQVDMQNLQAQSAIQQQQLAAQAQSDNDARQAALRRAVARQRADFGASGLSPDDGSSEAVLLGLLDQSDEDQQSQDRLTSLRSAAIDQNLGSQNALDVLQRTQLAQQQKLQRMAESF